MTTKLPVDDYYRIPGGAAAVRRVQNDLIRVDTGERGGVVHDLERRFVWQYDGSVEMMERIASEQVIWDEFSDKKLKAEAEIAPLLPESRKRNWWDYPLYADPGCRSHHHGDAGVAVHARPSHSGKSAEARKKPGASCGTVTPLASTRSMSPARLNGSV